MNTCIPRLIAKETVNDEGQPSINIAIDHTCHCGHCRTDPKKQTKSDTKPYRL